MARSRVKRPYDASHRRLAAELTRVRILEAARTLFLQRGYSATTMTGIAREAAVSLDTVYASLGPKDLVFRLLIETAISGTDQAVPAEERDYVRAIREEPTAAGKIALYAAALTRIQARLAPLMQLLKEASAGEPQLRGLWEGISQRRAANMRLFVADLAGTGALDPSLDQEEAADVIWATGAPEMYLLLVQERGWTDARYRAWLSRSWGRWVLPPPAARAAP